MESANYQIGTVMVLKESELINWREGDPVTLANLTETEARLFPDVDVALVLPKDGRGSVRIVKSRWHVMVDTGKEVDRYGATITGFLNQLEALGVRSNYNVLNRTFELAWPTLPRFHCDEAGKVAVTAAGTDRWSVVRWSTKLLDVLIDIDVDIAKNALISCRTQQEVYDLEERLDHAIFRSEAILNKHTVEQKTDNES